MKLTRMSRGLFTAALLLCAAVFTACGLADSWEPEVAPGEIGLDIQLDVGEEIGLLLADYEVNGKEGTGGIGNADKSMLGADEHLFYTLALDEGGDPGSEADVVVSFSVVTIQAEPNLDAYPPEYTLALEPISRTAAFGEYYGVRITGDKENGYKAVWED